MESRDFFGWLVVFAIVFVAIDRAAERGYFQKGADLFMDAAAGMAARRDVRQLPSSPEGAAEDVDEDRQVANQVQDEVEGLQAPVYRVEGDREAVSPPASGTEALADYIPGAAVPSDSLF